MSSTASDNSNPTPIAPSFTRIVGQIQNQKKDNMRMLVVDGVKDKQRDEVRSVVKQEDIEVIMLDSDSEDEVVQKCSTKLPSSLSSIEAPETQSPLDGTTDRITNGDHLTVQITDSSSSESSLSRHTPGKAQTKRLINSNKSSNGSIKRSKNASSSSKRRNPQQHQKPHDDFENEPTFGTFLSIESSSAHVPPRRAERLTRYRAWYRENYQEDDSDDEDYQAGVSRKKIKKNTKP